MVSGGSLPALAWRIVKERGSIKPAGQVFPTNINPSMKIVPPEKYDIHQEHAVKFVKTIAPYLLHHPIKVQVINDPDARIGGCTQWLKNKYIYTINIAHGDCANWTWNFHLLIHELSHHAVQSNDHLHSKFYRTVTEIGAMLGQLAIAKPQLFKDIPQPLPKPLEVVYGADTDTEEEEQEEAVAA